MKIAAINQTHTLLTAQELYNVMKIQILLIVGVPTPFCTDIHMGQPVSIP